MIRTAPLWTIVLAALAPAALASPAQAEMAADEAETRIAEGFAALGMGAERSACFGRVVAANTDGPDRAEAVRAVEEAEASDEVREGVKEGGIDVVQAFLAAETECGGD